MIEENRENKEPSLPMPMNNQIKIHQKHGPFTLLLIIYPRFKVTAESAGKKSGQIMSSFSKKTFSQREELYKMFLINNKKLVEEKFKLFAQEPVHARLM